LIFDGTFLRDPPGTIYFGLADTPQRDLFWDFENPDPGFPYFWGTHDPEFADYRQQDGSVHDGCDDYRLGGMVNIKQVGAPQDPAHGEQMMWIPRLGLVRWHLNNIGSNAPGTWKHVWWQFDYWDGFDHDWLDLPPIQVPAYEDFQLAHHPATRSTWGTLLFYMLFSPNPPSEDFEIINGPNTPLFIDNVRIVTQHVPEPATLALLALSAPLLRRLHGSRRSQCLNLGLKVNVSIVARGGNDYRQSNVLAPNAGGAGGSSRSDLGL
jgi:hypothetical protein